MSDYRIKLECCGRVVRLRLPNGVRPVEAWLLCEKCDHSTLDQAVKGWQDASRTYVTVERVYATRIDCPPARREAA